MYLSFRVNDMAAQITSDRPVTLALWLMEQIDKMRTGVMYAANYQELVVRLDAHATGELEQDRFGHWGVKPEVLNAASLDIDSVIELAELLRTTLRPAKPVG